MRALLFACIVRVAAADTAPPKKAAPGESPLDEWIQKAEELAFKVNDGKAPLAELEPLLQQITARGRFDQAALFAENALVHRPPREGDLVALRALTTRLLKDGKGGPAETWRRGVDLWLSLAWFAKVPRQVATAGTVVFDDLDNSEDKAVKRSHRENLGKRHSLYTDLEDGRTTLQGPPVRCDAKCCDFFDGHGAGDTTAWRITRACWAGDGSVERVGRRSN
jgi:hypothetical protein